MDRKLDADSRPASIQRLPTSRIILLGLLIPPIGTFFSRDNSISSAYLREQDLPILVMLVAAMVVMTFRIPALRLPLWNLRWSQVVPAAALLVLMLWWGTYAIMANYALTRDEHMVLFDMGIFAKGHLAEPLAAEWRPFLLALVPDFALEVPGSAALLSNYLPGNAMLRMAFSRVADPALMNPLLVGISLLALFDIARRLFPKDPQTVLVALALYAMSTQVLASAMTNYAMTAHTALNLIWLMLFLRDRPWAHALAMVISVVACGLHQLVFHPLFAGPFLLWRLRQSRYGLFATYTIVFVAALLICTLYPGLAIRSVIVEATAEAAAPGYFWRDRVLPVLLEPNGDRLFAAVVNLVRYATWQHLALIPLAAMSWPLIRRGEGIVIPLAAGIGLTLLFCHIVLPYQGHGWGYRYFCGVLGNAVLLAAFGYRRYAAQDRRAAEGLFGSLTVLTVLAGGWLLWQAHHFVAPYVRVDRLATSATSDMVLIDTEAPKVAIDSARNRADLSNRPILLASSAIGVSGLAELCKRGSISLLTRGDMREVGFARHLPERNRQFEQKVAAALQGQPCLVPLSLVSR